MKRCIDDYLDIINLQNPEPLNHKRMSMRNRAAQFSPFSALSGFNDSIDETKRLIDEKIDISEDDLEIMNLNFKNILCDFNKKVEIIFFVKDLKKQGGEYKKINGIIKKFDEVKRVISINDLIINLDDIIYINYL